MKKARKVKGQRYSSDNGFYLKGEDGKWYSLMSSFKWKEKEMTARTLSQITPDNFEEEIIVE